jgi:Domain of unknown function (DUF4129)
MMTAAGAHAAVPAAGPGIGRRAGQELARRELSKLIYHPPESIVGRLIAAILRFLSTAGGATPGGWWTLVALAGVLVIVAAGVLAWIGPVRRSGRPAAGPMLSGKPLTARDYRENAKRHADAGQFAPAIVERMRAIAAELDERGVLSRLPGRTADELAAEAGRVLPAMAAELTAAAQLFDDVRYGDRAGTLAGYQRLCDLDDRIRAARPSGAAAQVPVAAQGPS